MSEPDFIFAVRDDDRRGPVIYRARILKITAKLVRTERTGLAFGCGTQFVREQVCFSAEEAIARYRFQQSDSIEACKRRIVECERNLERIDSAPIEDDR
jgi:hypothetical protein